MKTPLPKGVQWHAVDLMDPAAVKAMMAAVRPTDLLHLAWIATSDVYRHSPVNFEWLEASLVLLRNFVGYGGTRFVGVGSSSEYWPGDGSCREDETPIAPVTTYGRCKTAFWMAAQAYAQQHGLSAAWGRVFVPYGPGDSSQRLVPSLISALTSGRPIDVTEGSQVRDFIHAADVAALLTRLLATPTATGAFNVGTGRGVAVRDVIQWIADWFGARALVNVGALPKREDEPDVLVADTAKVRSLLDWDARISLERGLSLLLPKVGSPKQDSVLGPLLSAHQS